MDPAVRRPGEGFVEWLRGRCRRNRLIADGGDRWW
jgi:hypothetical protein